MSRMFRKTVTILCAAGALISGCAGRTMVLTNPPDADVFVDGERIDGNSFKYGRWVGNEHEITVSASGFQTQAVEADVHLGARAGAIAAVLGATIIGIPFIPIIVWHGELDDRIYVSLPREVR